MNYGGVYQHEEDTEKVLGTSAGVCSTSDVPRAPCVAHLLGPRCARVPVWVQTTSCLAMWGVLA